MIRFISKYGFIKVYFSYIAKRSLCVDLKVQIVISLRGGGGELGKLKTLT